MVLQHLVPGDLECHSNLFSMRVFGDRVVLILPRVTQDKTPGTQLVGLSVINLITLFPLLFSAFLIVTISKGSLG